MTLADAQVVVFQAEGGGDGEFDVSLYADAGGVPGSLIATIATGLTATFPAVIVTATGATPELLAGTQYWLVLSPFDSMTDIGWSVADTTTVPIAQKGGTNPWNPLGEVGLQFEIDGTSASGVPEPASDALMAAGGLALVCLAGRKKETSGASELRT